MKSITLLLIVVGLTLQLMGQSSPRFDDYEVQIYRGGGITFQTKLVSNGSVG